MVQNLAWAVGYNVFAIPLAAGALAFAGVVMPPAVGALAMSISTIVVAANAMLLRRLDLRPAYTVPRTPVSERADEVVHGVRR
jgi:Cu2+-exporting ATPase